MLLFYLYLGDELDYKMRQLGLEEEEEKKKKRKNQLHQIKQNPNVPKGAYLGRKVIQRASKFLKNSSFSLKSNNPPSGGDRY